MLLGSLAVLGLLFLCPLKASAASTITGRVFADTGSTMGLGGVTVAASLNGAASAGTAVTDGNGYFTVTGIDSLSLTGGTVVTLFIDGNATQKAVTVSHGSGGSMTGMTLIKNALVIQSGTGGSQMGSPITSANLVTAKASNSADSDIAAIFTMSSKNLTVVAGKNMEVRQGGVLGLGGTLTTSYLHLSALSGSVIQGNNAMTINTLYTQSGGTFVGSNGGAAMTLNNTSRIIIEGGRFTATNGTTQLGPYVTLTGSSLFMSNSGTVVTYSSGVITYMWLIGSVDFNNVTLGDGPLYIQPNGLMRVRGNLSIQGISHGQFCGQLQAFSGVTITGAMYPRTDCADGDPTWTIRVQSRQCHRLRDLFGLVLPDTPLSPHVGKSFRF